MNKKFIPLVLILLLSLCAIPVFSTTDVNVDVTGDDIDVDINVDYGDDANASLSVNADWGDVSFSGTDYDNNPYGYGVDSTSTSVNVDMTGLGGYMTFDVNRLDSASSYGVGGQLSSSWMGFNDGSANFSFRTATNYASLVSSNYGFHPNGQFMVDADDFGMGHSLYANPNELAYLTLYGTGIANIDYMADGYTSSNGFKFGTGDGCYENADVSATGAGALLIHAQADNNLWSHDGSWSIGGGSYTGSWTYSGTLIVDDYAIYGN